MKKYIGLLPLLSLMAAFLVIPLVMMVIGSFQSDFDGSWTFANYQEFFTNSYYYQALFNSLLITLLSCILGLIGAIVLCLCLLQLSEKTQEKITFVSNLAANFAGIPLAFSFIILLGNAGVLKLLIPQLEAFNLYSWWGLGLTYMYFQIPLGVLFLYPSMKEIKKEWAEVAATLGVTSAYYWRKVVLPFLKPSLITTFIILFANGMGTYETAYALTGSNVNLLTVRIASLVAGDVFAKPNMGSALSVLFGLLMVSLMTIVNRRQKK